MISKSSLAAMRSRTCRPVVPASPSIKIFFLASNVRRDEVVAAAREYMEEGLNALPAGGAAKAAKMNETAVTILVIGSCQQ